MSESKLIEYNGLDDFIEKAQKEDYVFRGQAGDWELLHSIGRNGSYVPAKERQLFLSFKSWFYSYTRVEPKDDMDILFLAQHYGLKTRLLDWTTNPLIALYFACSTEGESSQDGIIYFKKRKSAGEFLKEAHTCFPFKGVCSQLLIPDYIDIRYRNQSGLFYFFENPEDPDTDYQMKMSIPFSIKQDLEKKLNAVKINETFVFPNLSSLCKELNENLYR